MAREGRGTGLPIDKEALRWLDTMIALRPLDKDGAPKSWGDIKAFADATGRADIGPELELLENMCHEYRRGFDIGSKALGIAPSEGQKIERQSHSSPRV